MAFWLRLVTFKSVPRSLVPFRPTVFSFASPFLIIKAGHRSYTTMPNDDLYDQAWVKNMCPKISSMSIGMRMENDRYTSLTLGIPNEGFIYLSAPVLEKWDTSACVKHNTLLIQGKTLKEIKDGMLKTTLPKEDDFKTNIMSNITADIITSFRDITGTRSWRYYDMFYDRSILGEVFCPAIAMLSPINSFSIYKKETDDMLSIWIEMPGEEKMKLTTQGLRVSLNLRRKHRLMDDNGPREPEIEDVKTFFDYDTFFIEEKIKNEHYITGIHLPESIHKKHNVIKKHLKDRVFHAFLPYVKKQEIKIN